MNKFSTLIEDKEWATILDGMKHDISSITLSDIDARFLNNLSILQEMETIGKSCEELNRYHELVSNEDWNEIWTKIKKFFVDLWNRFILFIKNIPNYIRPYTQRLTAINNRLGVDLNIKPGQQITMLPFAKLQQLSNLFMTAEVTPINGIPTITDANGTPFHDLIQTEKFQFVPVLFNTNDEYRMHNLFVITTSDQMQQTATILNNKFNEAMVNFTPPVGVDTNAAKVLEAFKEDIIFLSNFQQKLIETAKNLCKAQFE